MIYFAVRRLDINHVTIWLHSRFEAAVNTCSPGHIAAVYTHVKISYRVVRTVYLETRQPATL
jgi:hypothetical protein